MRTTPTELLEQLYIHHGLDLSEIEGKVVLEIGAGCSQYIPLFLKHGCSRFYANDLIPERLAVIAPNDPRFVVLPGDFREIEIPEKVDIVFCSLTLMMLKPLFPSLAKAIHGALKPGGIFVCTEANYTCPLTLWRWWRRYDPSIKIYTPRSLAKAMIDAGLAIERMTPITPPLPWTRGIWLLGTNFWLRARRPMNDLGGKAESTALK